MFERFMATHRFGSLDGLRALSILAVLWHHSGLYHGTGILARGQMGVYLFFAISGFLITTLLIRERQRTGIISLRGFYVRRSLRIFPLYYAVILVYIVAVALFEHGPDGDEFFGNLPYFLTYTSNWFLFVWDDGRPVRVIFYLAWSLATEEQFYCTWPWIERYASPAVRRWCLAALIAIAAAVHFGLLVWLIPVDTLLYQVLWSVAPPILFGVAIAHLMHNRVWFERLELVFGRKWSAPLVAAGLVTLLALPEGTLVRYLIYMALTALVLTCVIREDNGLAPFLRLPPMVRLGVVSYGIYLMHMLTFATVDKVGAKVGIGSPVLLWLLGVLAVYVVAEISFATFERWFHRFRYLGSRPQEVSTKTSGMND